MSLSNAPGSQRWTATARLPPPSSTVWVGVSPPVHEFFISGYNTGCGRCVRGFEGAGRRGQGADGVFASSITRAPPPAPRLLHPHRLRLRRKNVVLEVQRAVRREQ